MTSCLGKQKPRYSVKDRNKWHYNWIKFHISGHSYKLNKIGRISLFSMLCTDMTLNMEILRCRNQICHHGWKNPRKEKSEDMMPLKQYYMNVKCGYDIVDTVPGCNTRCNDMNITMGIMMT